MSLRVRLVLLILALFTVTVVALSAVQLETLINSKSADTFERADFAGIQVSRFLSDHIGQHLPDYPPPEDVEQAKALWTEIVSTDPDIEPFLIRSMAFSNALLEINIAGDNGLVLVSSNPQSIGLPLLHYESLADWSKLPWYRRIYDLWKQSPNWEVAPPPIGIAGRDEPVFTIQVLTSSVLVRDTLNPYLERVAFVSGGSLVAAMLITVFSTHRILRPLQRIESTIDRISQGRFQAGEDKSPLVKEFQAVESKLALLGQQFRDARESSGIFHPPSNIGEAVERMASQLDVATRLAAISRLSGGVAHEIKNPLNAILLRLDFLKARMGDSDPELGQELDVLSKEVLRLDRVVKTFLDFSRPVEVRFEDLDLTALVREVTELIKPQATLAHIQVFCNLPDRPTPMSGDPDLLRQALLNLITNAVEAMSTTGGELHVTVREEGGEWILEIADTGPGIPEEVRQKVFQLYFTTKSKGSGIGLAMTYRAVQLHNGVISFSSEAGRGTTFRLAFPATVRHV